ncbi:hypothetical protein [Pseudonocardia sp. WMMC193]|uniref:hypothetical protein n=1 Tax=Pseudonocardia sp. WMMC193 TaxID=2911965 RepID=UPI001F1A7689|nr:hypothetical protein [Pseudonocardia sp. WMMC193]MCF7550973.1 hypothetical protein [Pseudonocardia sp. WMMC193]
MAVRVQLNFDGIRQVMQLPVVREALTARARPIAARAAAIASGQGLPEVSSSIDVENGTRPRGRTYSRVVSAPPNSLTRGQSVSSTDRRRILARAADINLD